MRIEAENLVHSLISRCGKCPKCGHYLTIKCEEKGRGKRTRHYKVKQKCINSAFGCTYEEDISDDFNNYLGIKKPQTDPNEPIIYYSGENPNKEERIKYIWSREALGVQAIDMSKLDSETRKAFIDRSVYGKKIEFGTKKSEKKAKRLDELFHKRFQLASLLSESKISEYLKENRICRHCNEPFDIQESYNIIEKRQKIIMRCPLCYAEAEITSFYAYEWYLQGYLTLDELKKYGVKDKKDCKIKWIYPGRFR